MWQSSSSPIYSGRDLKSCCFLMSCSVFSSFSWYVFPVFLSLYVLPYFAQQLFLFLWSRVLLSCLHHSCASACLFHCYCFSCMYCRACHEPVFRAGLGRAGLGRSESCNGPARAGPSILKMWWAGPTRLGPSFFSRFLSSCLHHSSASFCLFRWLFLSLIYRFIVHILLCFLA